MRATRQTTLQRAFHPTPLNRALSAMGWITLVCTTPAFAQQSDTKPADASAKPANEVLEQIVVTGQKRSELLKEVPQATSAYSAKTLESLGVTNTTDLVRISPSVSFNQSANVRGEAFQVRGIGTATFSDSVEQSVGFVVDGVSLARSGQAAGDLLDVATIEVLRGPQGMLFGKNASAGLVSITTNRPKFGETTVSARTSFARGNENKTQIIGNVPLTSNAAMRFAYGTTVADGYVRNIFKNIDLNDRNDQTYRARFLVNPTNNLDIDVIIDGSEKRTLCCAWTARSAPATTTFGALNARFGIVPSPTNLSNAASGDFFQNSRTKGISAEANYDMNWAVLTSLTSVRGWKTSDNNDPDILPANILDRNLGSTDLTQKSQEFRLTSPSGKPLEWVTGLYWSSQRSTTINDQAGTLGQTLPAGAVLGTETDSTTTNKSAAIFGQGSYKLGSGFRVIAGARYTQEKLGLTLNQFKSPGALASIPGRFNGTVIGDVKKTNLSWRLTGQYDLNQDHMVYATAARGFKGPGVNTLNLPAAIFEVVQPEIPTTIEAGMRSTLFGGTTQFNTAIFKSEFKNFQAQVYDQNVTPGRFRVANAGRLDSQGIEFEFAARPVKGLLVSGGAAFIDSTYGEFKNVACYTGQTILPFGTPRSSPRDCIRVSAAPTAVATTEGTGNRLTSAPKTTFNVAMRYEAPLAGGTAFGQINYFWRDKASYSAAGDPNLVQGAFGILGASVGIGPTSGAWQLSIFGKNLADKKFTGNIISQPVLNAPGVYSQFTSPDARRIFGIMGSVKFGK